MFNCHSYYHTFSFTLSVPWVQTTSTSKTGIDSDVKKSAWLDNFFCNTKTVFESLFILYTMSLHCKAESRRLANDGCKLSLKTGNRKLYKDNGHSISGSMYKGSMSKILNEQNNLLRSCDLTCTVNSLSVFKSSEKGITWWDTEISSSVFKSSEKGIT